MASSPLPLYMADIITHPHISVHFYPKEKSEGVDKFPLRGEKQDAIIRIVDSIHDRKVAAS
jgi:hypothetical protein